LDYMLAWFGSFTFYRLFQGYPSLQY
jgi:hypothetical protein